MFGGFGVSYMCKPKAYDLGCSSDAFFINVSWIAPRQNQTLRSETELKSQCCRASGTVLQSLPLAFVNLFVLSSRMFLTD